MSPTKQMSWFMIGVLASQLVSGCAADAIRSGHVSRHYHRAKSDNALARSQQPANMDTGSIDKGPVTSKNDPRWAWCEQRHIEYQAGKAPGGATDLAKKLDDDRICAAVYQQDH